jgi:hypothetical protein
MLPYICEFRSFNTLCILLNIHMGEVKADNYQWHHALSIVIGSAWCCIVRRHRNSRTGFRNKCSTLSVVGTVPAPSALCCSPSTFINCGVRSFLLLHSTVWNSLTYNEWAVTIRTQGFLNFLDSAQVNSFLEVPLRSVCFTTSYATQPSKWVLCWQIYGSSPN